MMGESIRAGGNEAFLTEDLAIWLFIYQRQPVIKVLIIISTIKMFWQDAGLAHRSGIIFVSYTVNPDAERHSATTTRMY